MAVGDENRPLPPINRGEKYTKEAVSYKYARDPLTASCGLCEPPRVPWRLHSLRGWGHGQTKQVLPRGEDRAVRMVLEHQDKYESQWAAITSIAEKIGCTAETLRSWVRQAERDAGHRPGLTTEERARLKQLERENFERRRANEILRKASAYFAQAELDRRAK
jgi:transposase